MARIVPIIMTNRSGEKLASDSLNRNYRDDIDYSMKFLYWILTPIGIAPLVYDDVSKMKKVFSVFAAITCFSSFLFIIVPCSLAAMAYHEDIEVKIKLCGAMSFLISSTIKYCFLGLKRNDIKSCIARVESDWKSVQVDRHHDIMMRQVAISRGLATTCAVFLYSGGMSYHTIMPLLSGKVVYGNVTIRPLTYPTFDGIFDSQVSPTYEIVFATHCLCAMIMQTVTISACSLAATLVTHACGQLQIVMARLNDLVEGDGREHLNVNQRFAVIMKDHINVLRFTRQIEKVLREICLVELVASTFMICLLEFFCIKEWNDGDTVTTLTYIILIFSFTFNTFIFCFIGELIVNQCRNVGVVSYSIEWYRLPDKKSLDLILMIAISSYPPKITAGKIVELSVFTFGRVLKSSMAYMNLLRAVLI